MWLMRSNLLNQILLIAVTQLIVIAAAAHLRHAQRLLSSSSGASDTDSFKPKLIKLDEWVVADLNTSTLVNNVSLLVRKLNNYTGGVVHAFELFHTEVMAFQDVLNQTTNITEDLQKQVDAFKPNKVILDVIRPMVGDFNERVARSVDQLKTVVDDYYKGIKFGTEESYERVGHDLKNNLNEIITETEETFNSTKHGQVAVMDLVDLAQEYYNQFENGLLREAIALSEFRRVLKDENNSTVHAMNASIIIPFLECENAADSKTVACLQDAYKDGSSIKEILDLDEMVGKFEVRFREKRSKYISFIDGQTDSAVDLFANTMKVFYEVIGKLKDDGVPSGADVLFNAHATVFVLTFATLCLFKVFNFNDILNVL